MTFFGKAILTLRVLENNSLILSKMSVLVDCKVHRNYATFTSKSKLFGGVGL